MWVSWGQDSLINKLDQATKTNVRLVMCRSCGARKWGSQATTGLRNHSQFKRDRIDESNSTHAFKKVNTRIVTEISRASCTALSRFLFHLGVRFNFVKDRFMIPPKATSGTIIVLEYVPIVFFNPIMGNKSTKKIWREVILRLQTGRCGTSPTVSVDQFRRV